MSGESPPLAAGKLADDKLTVGILFLTLTRVSFYSTVPPVEVTDSLITCFVDILINWIRDICLSGFLDWMHLKYLYIEILCICIWILGCKRFKCWLQLFSFSYRSPLHIYTTRCLEIRATLSDALQIVGIGRESDRRVKNELNEDKWRVMGKHVHGKVWVQSRLCPALIYFSGEAHSMILKIEVKAQIQKMSVTPFLF